MNAPKYFRPFDWTDDTFENRVGKPEVLYAALGIITMNFSELEYVIDRWSRTWQDSDEKTQEST